jgi:hypothetical protein
MGTRPRFNRVDVLTDVSLFCCLDCGAVTLPDYAERHMAWHDTHWPPEAPELNDDAEADESAEAVKFEEPPPAKGGKAAAKAPA